MVVSPVTIGLQFHVVFAYLYYCCVICDVRYQSICSVNCFMDMSFGFLSGLTCLFVCLFSLGVLFV